MTTGRPSKAHYSQTEAAAALGVSVEKLRTVVRSHISDTEEDLNNLAATTFHPSDLLLLKLLCGSAPPTGSN